MERIHFSITINAPIEHVWKTMLEQDSYRLWTEAFMPGSRYEGSFEEGAEIRFIGPDPETGKEGGMLARIKESRPYEFISIEHLGIINDGVVDTESDAVKAWVPAYENYTFTAVPGGTEVSVDMDTADEHKEMFEEMWPKALQKLKELAEK